MPDILAMLISERNKLNRAIEALGGEIGHAIIRITKTGPVGPGSGGTGGIRKGRSGPKPGQRFHTAASRAKIAAAQRARWAKSKGQLAAPAKRTFSAAARARIAAGARARWAKAKGQTAQTKTPAKPVKKFTMSPEARAKISKAMKARWAANKKGG
jgi:hypothetical protein